MLTAREFLGEEFYKQCVRDYEEVRRWLKAGAEPRELLPVYRAFDQFYKSILK